MSAASERIDTLRLALAIEAVEDGLMLAERTLPPDKKAELIKAAYDLITQPDAGKGNVIEPLRLPTAQLSSSDLLDLLRAVFPQALAQAEGMVLLPLRVSARQAMEQGGLLSLLEIPQIEILAGHPIPHALDLLALLSSRPVQFPLQNSIVKSETGF